MFRLPEHLRRQLKRPFGTLYPSLESVLPLIEDRPVYTVGDVVTHRLLRLGITPAIAIIDGMSMRSPCEKRPQAYAPLIHTRNPAGTITHELIEAIGRALKETPAIIFVEGEEDLAVIPLIIAAPDGGVVLYGQPDEGVVMRLIDRRAKQEAESILSQFLMNEGK
ncbi:MAG: GTP-dependent dephospho-CoA kinase family protein [Methanomicrobiales archaeon]|nr:GTP-dependent dephospho-CoA kinase family protein [Methanomicrobiales archaeon]